VGKPLAHKFSGVQKMQVDSTQQFVDQLNWHSNQSTQALERLASGSRLLAPQDDAAGLAVSSRMKAKSRQLNAVANNIANGISYTQTQDGFLKGAQEVLNRMGTLAIRAQDTTLSSGQRAIFQDEFRALKDTFNDLRTTQYNGRDLFNGKELNITTSPEQKPLTSGGVNLFTSDISSVTAKTTHLDTPSGAQSTLRIITQASEQITQHRTGVGTALAGLQSASNRLTTQHTNLQSALSRISDADVATEATNLAKSKATLQTGIYSIKHGNIANSHLSNLLG